MNPDKFYSVEHSYEINGCEMYKLIGLYRTRSEARQVVAKLRSKPGFKDHPRGFKIWTTTIGSTGWQEGFITASDALEEIRRDIAKNNPGVEPPTVLTRRSSRKRRPKA